VPVVGRRAAAAECHPGLPCETSRQTVRHSELAGRPWPTFREQGWKADFMIAFSDIAEGDGHIQDVIEAVNAIAGPAPSGS
jgi:hypothetical protein